MKKIVLFLTIIILSTVMVSCGGPNVGEAASGFIVFIIWTFKASLVVLGVIVVIAILGSLFK